MKEKFFKFIRRRAVMLIAILLIGAGIGGIALAQFTLSHRAKRVIAANGTNDQYFSSNYMQIQQTKKTRMITEDTYRINVDVTVCNYAQGTKNAWYDGYLSYTLTAYIVKPDEGPNAVSYAPLRGTQEQQIWIQKENDATTRQRLDRTTSQGVFSWTFDGTSADQDTYYVSLPMEICESGYFVLLIAQPDPLELKPISVLLSLQHNTGEVESSWGIRRIETAVTDENIDSYSGFNYQIYGSGEGTLELTWDQNKLEISKVFLDRLGTGNYQETSQGIQFSTSALASSGQDIQFYRAAGVTSLLTSDLDSVHCELVGG